MIYPAFTQQKECGPYTITVSMNLDTWQMFMFACERIDYEKNFPCKTLADCIKSGERQGDWEIFADKLWKELTKGMYA